MHSSIGRSHIYGVSKEDYFFLSMVVLQGPYEPKLIKFDSTQKIAAITAEVSCCI